MWGIFKIGSDRKIGDIYLADGFGFHWFFNNPATVKIHYDVDLLAVKFTLNRLGFKTSIMDKSTADILSKLLDIEVPAELSVMILKPGDILYIFRLGITLKKGQVLSKEEVLDLYKQGKAKFVMLEVLK